MLHKYSYLRVQRKYTKNCCSSPCSSNAFSNQQSFLRVRSEDHLTREGRWNLPFQSVKVPVKVVLTSGERTTSCVFPKRPGTPSWQSADRTPKVNEPQWVGTGKSMESVSALDPPIGVGVDHREDSGSDKVFCGKVTNPFDNLFGAHAIASRAIWEICRVHNVRLIGRSGERRVCGPYLPTRWHPEDFFHRCKLPRGKGKDRPELYQKID